MKTLKQRIATAALAGAMTLSLAVPAFASSNTTKVTATYSEIAIDVTVPATATVTINPMEMPVKLPVTDKENDTATEVSSQLVTMPSAIVNRCSMDLIVGATVTGTVKGNLKFATVGWDATDKEKLPTTNSAFVYLEMKAVDADDVLGDANDKGVKSVDATKMGTAWAAWTDRTDDVTTADAVKALTDGTDDGNDAIVVVSTKATTSTQGLAKLAAAKDTDDDGVLDPQAGGVGLFRLAGQVAPSPKTAWAKADGFGATIAFTFKAVKPAAEATD